MTGSNVEQIKEKLDIVEFLKGYIRLQPAGKNFKALCPFHNEKSPSFMISPERQTWHCFGCALGGDIFAFLMRYENLEFGEAMRLLAEKAGVDLKFSNSPDYKFSGLLYEINDAATKFFVSKLAEAAVSSAYLKSRGLLDETIHEFEIGWSSNEPEALNLHLLNLGYAPPDIVRAGLAFKSERGFQLDRFRGRLMFPIHNHLGKVVGFTGRILPELDTGQMGKYVNSPETPIFNKSKLLYGFWKSKNAIREANEVFLVEGQMDFLMSYQAGIKNVVASSGTALTAEHLLAMRRLTDQMVINFDSDEAGMAAGERAIDLAQAHDYTVRIVLLGSAKDPAEAIQKDPVSFLKLYKEARPAPEFYFERYLAQFASLSPADLLRASGFKKNLRIVLGKIKNMTSPVEQSGWLRELGRRTGIEENALREEEAKTFGSVPKPELVKENFSLAPAPTTEEIPTRREFLSQHLLAACITANDFSILEESLPHLTPSYVPLVELLKSGVRKSADKKLDELINKIVLQAGQVSGEDMAKLKEFLMQEYLKEKRAELTRALKQAEVSGDEAAMQVALEKLNSLR